MITIVDYGMGNVGSIQNMIKKIGGTSEITADPEKIASASKIILPGVGHFDRAMKNLEQLRLIPVISSAASSGTPILGICLGMQLLAESSEEGVARGLCLIPGKVMRFVVPEQYKVPHMGWNSVEFEPACPLYDDFGSFGEARFYFVHSYHFVSANDAHVTGRTPYGNKFVSSVSRGNVHGVQFHPEKSHKFGMKLLKNFIELC